MTEYVAQGGDWGAAVTQTMGIQAPQGCWASTPTCRAPPRPSSSPASSAATRRRTDLRGDELAAYEQLRGFYAQHVAYALIMSTRPQTMYGLADSPIDLAAFAIDHGDGTGQPGLIAKVLDGSRPGELTRDDILDNITLYWLTNTGVSASRFYWENKADFFDAKPITIPFAISVFPDELYQAPRSWAQRPTPTTSSTTGGSTAAGTSPPGRSPSCSARRCATASGHCAPERRRAIEQTSAIACDHITTIPAARLGRQIGQLLDTQGPTLTAAIHAAFDLDSI